MRKAVKVFFYQKEFTENFKKISAPCRFCWLILFFQYPNHFSLRKKSLQEKWICWTYHSYKKKSFSFDKNANQCNDNAKYFHNNSPTEGKKYFPHGWYSFIKSPSIVFLFFKSIFEFVGKKHKTISHKESQAERRMKGKIDHEIRVLSYQWIFGR